MVKICPVMSGPVRVQTQGTFAGDASGRHMLDLFDQPCIGSRCAAWTTGGDRAWGLCGMTRGGDPFPDPAQEADE